MGYLERSCTGDASRPTTAAMTVLGRLRASRRSAIIDVALGHDGRVYASVGSGAFDKAVGRGRIVYVGRYVGTASVGDVAEDIEFVWQKMVDKPQPTVILTVNQLGEQA